MTILLFTPASVRRRVASMPSTPGIRMSIRTTSGSKCADGVDRCRSVRGLAHDFEIRLGVEDHPKPSPDKRLVVDDEDSYRAPTLPSPASGGGIVTCHRPELGRE